MDFDPFYTDCIIIVRHMINYFNRYTSLPVLLDTLWEKHIILLDPSKWEDRNDAYFLAKYKEKKKLKSLLVYCLSMTRETYHNWRVYSDGIAGVCVEFEKNKLLSIIKKNRNLKFREVIYKTITELEINQPPLKQLPFIKRIPYRNESEFRVIYEDAKKEFDAYPISIPISIIKKITLSPSMPNSIAKTITDIIRSNEEFKSIRINRSSILENEKWKSIADKA